MSDEQITAEEYQTLQSQLLLFAAILREWKLGAFLAKIERAESFGPFVDPTLYRAADPRLRIIKQVAQAAHAMQSKLPTREECDRADKETKAWQQIAGDADVTG